MLRDEEHENICLVAKLPTKIIDLYFHTGGDSHGEAKM